jgi:cystathionine gamma-synthase
MNVPITMSSTYVHDSDNPYGRDGNDGWRAFEAAMGELDGGRAVSFGSGMAAAASIAELVPTGGIIVLPAAAYYGVAHLFAGLEERGRLTVRAVDTSDTEAVLAAADGADVVWVESIANPTMTVADVPAIAAGARERGAITVVDATFATPLRQRPLELGADIVLHSATKLIGGHSDLLLGVVVCASDAHAAVLASYRHDHGSIPGALEAFLALRGLRSLAVRLERAESNALELARRLAAHPSVTQVNYPGLEGDSQFERASRMLPDGCANMLSFEIDATPERTDEILASLAVFTHATSLGGVESLIERRARWAAEADAGVPLTLCRVSTGIEDIEDLWTDLATALT